MDMPIKPEIHNAFRPMTNSVFQRIIMSMLNQERIPIGKLKQAYGLSAMKIDELLAALWPNDVFPYELWDKIRSGCA